MRNKSKEIESNYANMQRKEGQRSVDDKEEAGRLKVEMVNVSLIKIDLRHF